MTEAVQIAVIAGGSAAFVATIPGVIAALAASAARRAAEHAAAVVHEVKVKTEETAHRIDGRMDELLDLTRKAAFKEGALQQKQTSDTLAAAVKEAQPTQVVIAQPQLPSTVTRQERDAG